MNIEKEVHNIILKITNNYDTITSVDLHGDGHLDSFSMITLVTMLEERFEFEFDGRELIPENFTNTEKIIHLIGSKLKP